TSPGRLDAPPGVPPRDRDCPGGDGLAPPGFGDVVVREQFLVLEPAAAQADRRGELVEFGGGVGVQGRPAAGDAADPGWQSHVIDVDAHAASPSRRSRTTFLSVADAGLA